MPLENKPSQLTKRFMLLWIGVCSATAVVFTSISASLESEPVFLVFIKSLVSTHAIGFGALLLGHWAWHRLEIPSVYRRYSVVVCFSLLGGLLGRTLILSAFYPLGWFEGSDFISPFGYAATLSITFMVSSATFVIWHLQQINSGSKELEAVFTFRSSRGEQGFIPFQDLIYLTADGKKTILHSKEGDRQASELLKDLLNRLPKEHFQRVHKKYAVQLSQITSMRHLKSGHYALFLSGEEYIIFASSRYVKALRQKLLR